jgi:serine O-acetyltransferase
MIRSKEDYKKYLEADRISLNKTKNIKSILFDDVWKFQRLMRKLEYITNCKKNKILKLYITYRYRNLGRKLGFYIPINVFGPGLSIAHPGTIVINGGVKIGSNCRLHVCVNIGAEAGNGNHVPQIGDNCYIAPGVKMFGNITLGSNIAIGANAVVNKSFLEDNITIGGIPGKVISNKSSEGLLIKGFSI